MNDTLIVPFDTLTAGLPEGSNSLVRVNIKYPLSGDPKIDGYTHEVCEGLMNFAEKRLVKRCETATRGQGKTAPFSLVASYRMTYNDNGFFCFWLDVFVWQTGGRSVVKRIPFNFDRQDSKLIFPLANRHKKEVISAVRQTLSRPDISSIYYPDCVRRAERYYKNTNALLTQTGIYLTYDSGLLCPHERGAVNVFVFGK